MDEVIFEEFKGTGNSEVVLSRNAANRRVYPALDIIKSGTRKEELLLSPDILQKKLGYLEMLLLRWMKLKLLNSYIQKCKKLKTTKAFFCFNERIEK